MREIDIENSNRKTTYEWFNSFRNSTYSMNVKMDVTKLVKYTKEQINSNNRVKWFWKKFISFRHIIC